jgi:hypothetical protein
MKVALIIIICFSLTGCAILGTNMIHSPSSDEGAPLKARHVHGGPTRRAPPDAIQFKIDDSTYAIVGARTIWERKNFGGVILPILPIFWLPRINYYKDSPNCLIIEMSTLSAPGIKSTDFEVESAAIIENSTTFELQDATKAGSFVELRFSLPAENITEFELTNVAISSNGQVTKLPAVRFTRMKQRWRFLGP